MAIKEIRIYPGDFGMLGQNTDDDTITLSQARAILDSAEAKAKKDGLTNLRLTWRREIWASKQETELEVAQRRIGIYAPLIARAAAGNNPTPAEWEKAAAEYAAAA